MPGILTRRIGPFPGWVWGAIGGGGFLVFMYMRRRGQTAQGQPGLPAVSPAASAVPFVPSVTVTGIPQAPSPAPQPGGQPGAQTPPAALWQFGGPPNSPTVWRATQVGQQNFQVTTGGSWPGGVMPGIPDNQTQNALGRYGWQWANVPSGFDPNSYASALNQSTQGSGSGGFGYAGAQSPASQIGGWTTLPWMTGYQAAPNPVSPGRGWGAGPTVNRTGTPSRRARRLFGGSGGGSAVNRTGARATRPLRARDLRGR